MKRDEVAAVVHQARSHAASGKAPLARELLTRVLDSYPQLHDIRAMLGALQLEAGDLAAAEHNLRASLAGMPEQPNCLVNLASCLLAQGRTGEALSFLKAAHALQPGHVGAWLVLARARLHLGDASGAEKCLRAAESLSQELPHQAWFQLAGVLQERKAFEEAKPYYSRAIRMDPGNFLYRGNFADMLCSIGEIEQGKAEHADYLRKDPWRLRSHLAIGLTLSGVLASAEEVSRVRTGFANALESLHESLPQFLARPAKEIEADVRWCNYLLAYHGRDDLPLQRRFSEFQSTLLARHCPVEARTEPTQRSGRIRIGFASSFFYQCTVGWYFSSWILDLDPARFEVFVYSLGPTVDDLTQRLAKASNLRQVHHLPLFSLAGLIAADELDVLIYPELGLCPATFALAALRLAPVQGAGWGHPVTSGHASIDRYFTCALMEPEEADSHYAESLVRLPGLGTRYRAPAGTPRHCSRGDLGLPEGVALALVSQSLFKIHPENDRLYREILDGFPNIHFLFFEDSFSRNTQLFEKRMEALGIVRSRNATYLPRMSRERFLEVNSVADLMLDSLHWSGGNTSLDALSTGLPMVTRAGRFMRGRQSYAMLRELQLEELVVHSDKDYVSKAIELLRSSSMRSDFRAEISRRNSILFEQQAPTMAFQQAIESLCARG